MRLFGGTTMLLAVLAIAAATLPANAACKSSCTALRSGCISHGGNSAACSAGYAGCKKTGTYAGMPSGKTWTNICKK